MKYYWRKKIATLLGIGLLSISSAGCSVKTIIPPKISSEQSFDKDSVVENEAELDEKNTDILIKEPIKDDADTDINTSAEDEQNILIEETEPINNNSNTEDTNDHSEEVTEPQIEDSVSQDDLNNYKSDLLKQFETFNVEIDSEADKYISSLYIDGRNVKVELIDGQTVEGKLDSLALWDLTLDNLYIYDTEFENDYLKFRIGEYHQIWDDYNNKPKIKILTSPSYPIKVLKEFKYADHQYYTTDSNQVITDDDGDAIIFDNIDAIDYSHCENIWFYGGFYSLYDHNIFNSNPNLKRLILEQYDPYEFETNKTFTISSPSLKTLIINTTPVLGYSITDFDFKNCKNLEYLSFGNSTYIQNYDGATGLNKLKTVSFGAHQHAYKFSMNETFAEKEQELSEIPFLPSDLSVAYPNNNFIRDISGLKNNPNIETLNISSLLLIDSEQLYDLVQSLPNLKKIVGFPIKNAGMCSPELISYCNDNNIEQPFNEQSLQIKEQIKSVVDTLITPDMDEFKRIEVLSAYIMDHLQYVNGSFLTTQDDVSSEIVEKAWGNSLYYSTIDGMAICEGYAEYTLTLFNEAGITTYYTEESEHIFNIVELNGIYYEIDLTSLDTYLNEKNIDIDDFNFNVNSIYYLTPIDDETSDPALSEPYGAVLQRENSMKSESEQDIEESESFEPKSSTKKFDKCKVYKDSKANQCHTPPDEKTIKFISILIVLGIATPIPTIVLNKMLKEIQISTSNCPIWSSEELDQIWEQQSKLNDEYYNSRE